ncbi:MAG: HAD-IA family hydrolase [Pseudomonadota bacterium]
MQKDLIFDFDGVIADTRDMLFNLFLDYHPTLSDEDFLAHFDGNVYEEPRVKFTPENADHLNDQYCQRIDVSQVLASIDPIKRLSAHNRLFIVSSGDERAINQVLDEASVGHHFAAIFGHNTHRSKVAKFEMIRDKFGASLNQALFVTDTLGDVREAKKIGLTTLAETFGYHDRQRLSQGSPWDIVDTWPDVERAVERCFSG